MAWYRTALWLVLFSAVYDRCCSSPSRFSRSLSLTRSVRSRVQQLLLRYKEEQFGNAHFDDKRIVLNTLPSVTVNYRTWLQMEDTERLYRASRDLQTFWTHLESQRQRLQANGDQAGDMEMRKRNRRGGPYQSLSQSILGIELDLRDLMKQANAQ
ncbi:interleukin-27 subunit alpha-like, partial [Clarias magur]